MQEKEKYQMIQDKISGCVFAGALGDALGYVVEFDLYSSIKNKYGKDGIQDLLRTGEEAIISDDTQMTLFTMEGMSVETEDEVEEKIYLSYLKWAQTQGMSVKLPCDWPSRLAMVPKMNCRRAPGNTCLYALTSGKMGTIQEPINHSKGCGGVMRTAPLGFTDAYGLSLLNGAKAAAITHGHPLGWISAGMLSDIVFKCIYGKKKPLKLIIEESLADTKAQFERVREVIYFEQLIKKAIALSEMNYEDDVAIIEKELGGGWVGEEALAIAVYCCLKYPYCIKKAMIAAVNHSGDSDSTGAVAGNIIGAYLGMSAVPKDWMDRLELVDVMQEQIDDIMLMIRDR